jgi:hypothetical protein
VVYELHEPKLRTAVIVEYKWSESGGSRVNIPFDVFNHNEQYLALGNGNGNLLTVATSKKVKEINLKDSIVSTHTILTYAPPSRHILLTTSKLRPLN